MSKSNYQTDYDLRISAALGLVNGANQFGVFGSLENLTDQNVSTDVSQLGVAVIPLPDIAGEPVEIVSDSTSDDSDVMVRVAYLAADGEFRDRIFVTMNGTTPVEFPENVSRINEMTIVSDKGSTGEITVRQLGGGTVFGVIKPSDQQMNQCSFTIPKDYSFIVGQLVGTLSKSTGTEAGVKFTAFLKRSSADKWRRVFEFGAQRAGDNSIEFENRYPSSGVGPIDLKVSATSDTTQSVSVSAYLSGLVFVGK